MKRRILSVLIATTIVLSQGAFITSVQAATTNSNSLSVVNYSQNENLKWNFTRFGATTSEKNNTISFDENNKSVTLTSGTKDGKNAGGKVTGANDGISYCYTEIDPSQNFEISATVKVNYFEKESPDNQSGFGIMARDVNGTFNDGSVFPSNAVIVGGYRGKVQSVYRTGVTANLDSKISMKGEHKFADRPVNDGTATYKLTLKKTNTGYIASVNDGQEVTYYEPKLLETIDNKVYVGFFTARVASITVSNINLTTSDASKDPAGQKAPDEIIKPELNVQSSEATGNNKYDFKLKATISGNINVKLNDKDIYSGKVNSEDVLSIPSKLNDGDNKFDVVYTPDITKNNKDKTPINKSFNVNVKHYGDESGNIYVSADGTANGNGTKDNSVDIYTAVQYVGANQSIKVKGGTYNLTKPLVIESSNDGEDKNLKKLEAYDGRAILDFGLVSDGFVLSGDYWNIKGIDVTKTKDTAAGFRIAGNHNLIEDVQTYKNGDSGLQIGALSNDDPKEIWPSYNTILNCTSYDNKDAAMNNADGFAAKIAVGEGNLFKGCISHNNCDDGWDLFSKLEIGKIGAVRIEDSISYGNGKLTDGTVTNGDGNGFKLGGEGIPVKHTLVNSLSFDNLASGITSNSNPSMIVENSIAADNHTNYVLDYYTNAVLNFKLDNDLSFQKNKAANKDVVDNSVRNSSNYFYDGSISVNNSKKQLDESIFKSTDMPQKIDRDKDNNIIWPDYMKLKK